jgi:hypothetical protein
LPFVPDEKYKTKLYIVSLTLEIIKLNKMPDKNDFSELLAELLRGQDHTNERLERLENGLTSLRQESKENTHRTITAFNNFANAILKKNTGWH